jgi:pimeloyl-ACP methyl ester carboxylesterase
MAEWRQQKNPDRHWAPAGLPRWWKALPGWVARGAAESRFAREAAEFAAAVLRDPRAPGRGLPDGAGRPVLLVPGFGFGDLSTLPLQVALHEAGYSVLRSHIVANIRCSDRTVAALAEVAADAVARDGGRRLLVVGHSRGGMIGRGLAARHPDLVELVISLGAPLNHEFAFYEIPAPMVSALRVAHWRDPELRERRCVTAECTCPYMQAAHRPLPPQVRLVSLYSTTDGIVDWRACVVPGATNIEVPGSHLGMGLRPGTVRIVLSELAGSGG